MEVNDIVLGFKDDDLDWMFGVEKAPDFTDDIDYQLDMQAHSYQY